VSVDLDWPVRRLLPDCAETTILAELVGLELIAKAREERPYVITNFARWRMAGIPVRR
jgi:hypothetical protein